MRICWKPLLLLAAAPCWLAPLPASADLVRLKSGGELRGKVVKTADGESVTVATDSGARVTVAAAAVEFVTPRSATIEEYESRARRTPDAVPDQLELAEWCRLKGLTSQRMQHLQRVIELEPDHEKARAALGHIWQEGQWVDQDEMMAGKGYVKYKGKYITTLEMELIEKTEEEVEAEKAWYPRIRLWVNWLKGSHQGRQAEALVNLQGVTDPNACPAVVKFLVNDDANVMLRQLAVQVLSQPGGPKPVVGLTRLAVLDPLPELRKAALDALKPDQYATAQPYLLRDLRHKQNVVVCRAAAALERVGDDEAVIPLIQALMTTHQYTVRVPVAQMSVALGSNGAIGGSSGSSLPPDIEAGLRTGQYPNGVIVLNGPGPPPEAATRVVTVNYTHQNAEVLSALQKLTGTNFGFDRRTWRLYWNAEKAGVGKIPVSPVPK